MKHYMRFKRHGHTNETVRVGTGKTSAERFWSRVALTADDTRCWNWTGNKLPHGYGIVSLNGKNLLTHRYAWFLMTGEMPSKWILHTCHNTSCVNINHLYEGTAKDNARDRVELGTQPHGETHGFATTTEAQVREIKQLWAAGTRKFRISQLVGVSTAVIDGICNGRTWKHVTI